MGSIIITFFYHYVISLIVKNHLFVIYYFISTSLFGIVIISWWTRWWWWWWWWVLFLFLLGFHEPLLHILPIHDRPDRIEILWPFVLVVQIVRVFPHINTEQRRQRWSGAERVLIGSCGDGEGLSSGIVAEPLVFGHSFIHSFIDLFNSLMQFDIIMIE